MKQAEVNTLLHITQQGRVLAEAMSKQQILLVEDDKALLIGMCDLLEMSGYEVLPAEDGSAALEILENLSSPPDLIVSDIRMPNVDGYELLEAVRTRAEWLSIPFIFLTAKSEKEDVRYGKLRGADDYLTKPFDYQDLLVSIQSSLSRRDELDALQESRMESLRKRILTVLNHEFRTPLSFVVAYADLTASTLSDEHSAELRQYINGILEGSERLSRLIESFLLLAELESGHGAKVYERRKAPIDAPGEVINTVVNALRPNAAEKGVKLEVSIASPLPSIIGDWAYLDIALRHLLDNAIKFSPPEQETSVQIEAWVEGQHLVMAIRDHGRGIPLHEQDQLFDIFYQVDRDEYEQQGAGAGLPIVRHVAYLHGGRVELESEIGKGSCFRLILPIHETSS